MLLEVVKISRIKSSTEVLLFIFYKDDDDDDDDIASESHTLSPSLSASSTVLK